MLVNHIMQMQVTNSGTLKVNDGYKVTAVFKCTPLPNYPRNCDSFNRTGTVIDGRSRRARRGLVELEGAHRWGYYCVPIIHNQVDEESDSNYSK